MASACFCGSCLGCHRAIEQEASVAADNVSDRSERVLLGYTTTRMYGLVHYFDHTTANYLGQSRPEVTSERGYALCYMFDHFD